MTGSAADLRDLETATVAYCLRIEGCTTCFVSNPNLADGTWLTEHPTVLEGLRPPRISMAINPRTGAFSTTNVTFELEDIDDSIADLFASVRSDVADLESTLEAGSTATGATLYSKHIGTEAISSAGARMYCPAVPNYTIGYHHTGKLQASSEYQPIAPVSSSPYVWAGRRVCLLRVFHNEPSAGSDLSGVNWTAPANSDIVWHGTLLDEGDVSGKTWSISAVGIQSWLTRPLGQDTWTTGVAVSDSTGGFHTGEDYVGCFLAAWSNQYQYAYEYGEDSFSTQFGGAALSDIRTGVTTAIANALADSGADGTFASDGGQAAFSEVSHKFTVGWNNPVANAQNSGIVALIMHEKAWSRLGYEPAKQVLLDPANEFYVPFVQYDGKIPFPTGGVANPSGGYWVGYFATTGTEWPGLWNAFPVDQDQHRTYAPTFSGGTVVMSTSTPFEIELGHLNGEQPLFLDTQHDAPVANAVNDPSTAYSIGDSVGTVDRTRLFLFYGPRAFVQDDGTIGEAFMEYQVARCSWQDDSGKIAEASTSIQPRLVVQRWCDPRLYGFDRDQLKSDWVGLASTPEEDNRIYVVPLTHLGAYDVFQDPVGQIIQRILLTSGTGTGWSGTYAQPGTLDEGDNEPANDEPNPQYIKDYETYAMGLAIPSSVVQSPAEWRKEESKLPTKLRMAKVAYVGQVSAEDVMLGLMQPLGLCFHMRGGKIGMFNPWDLLSPEDAAITITTESYSAGDSPARARPRQNLRVYSPIDSLHVSWSWNPLEGGTQYETVHQSIDQGRRYRASQVEHKVDAHGLRLTNTAEWGPQLREHWQRGFRWWARRHFKVRVRLQRAKGQYCWPGTVVRYTDNWVTNPDGTYGVTNHVGFVTSVNYDCDKEEADVELLVQDTGAEGFRFYAPVARSYHYDTTNFVLYCYDDYYRIGYGHNDVAWFAEPSWSSLAGDMDVELLQYDGNTWTGGIYGTVTSVNAVAGDSYIQLDGALTGGTYYPQKDTLVVPREYTNQGATWALALFAPLANEDGEVNGSTANAVKFNGV